MNPIYIYKHVQLTRKSFDSFSVSLPVCVRYSMSVPRVRHVTGSFIPVNIQRLLNAFKLD